MFEEPARAAGRANSPFEQEVRHLYRDVLESWNRRDAAGFALLFTDDAHLIGFDGSQIDGRAAIEAELGQIFADHPTAAYVAIERGVRLLSPDVAVLRAVAGMVPPGQADINPAVNAIQTLIAMRRDGRWRGALFQNTPAAFHGRPEASRALTAELRGVLHVTAT